jgi:hypothetical protein
MPPPAPAIPKADTPPQTPQTHMPKWQQTADLLHKTATGIRQSGVFYWKVYQACPLEIKGLCSSQSNSWSMPSQSKLGNSPSNLGSGTRNSKTSKLSLKKPTRWSQKEAQARPKLGLLEQMSSKPQSHQDHLAPRQFHWPIPSKSLLLERLTGQPPQPLPKSSLRPLAERLVPFPCNHPLLSANQPLPPMRPLWECLQK